MANLYVLFYPFSRIPSSIPNSQQLTLSEEYTEKLPIHINSGWLHEFKWSPNLPANEENIFRTMLQILYLFINTKRKEPTFDYLYIQDGIWAISEFFLKYLRENIGSQIEAVLLKVYNKNREEAQRVYYAMRVHAFNDKLFDFHVESKKRTAGIKNYYLYPDMELKETNEKQNIYTLREFNYREVLILNSVAKNWIIENLYSPQIYKLSDFPYVLNNQYDKKALSIIPPLP